MVAVNPEWESYLSSTGSIRVWCVGCAGSVMLLLTSIYDNLSTEIDGQEGMVALVPRLFPFFRHALSSVRLATLRCLSSLLLRSGATAAWLLPVQLLPALRLTFQNLVTESDAKVVEASRVGPPCQRICGMRCEFVGKLSCWCEARDMIFGSWSR